MSVDKMQEIANVIGDTNADVHIIGGEPTHMDIIATPSEFFTSL
jgi:hypothetical protein